jgi:DNA-binding NarL/FixJ family response regulator
MTESVNPHCAKAPSRAPVRRDRSVQARRKAREAKTARERQVIDFLNRGVSVAEIASRSGVSIGKSWRSGRLSRRTNTSRCK